MNYLIGLDIGTSSIKGLLISADGKEKHTGKEAFTYTFREDGGVESTAESYLKACCALLKTLASKLPVGGNLCGVCAASASGNLLLLDGEGKPSTPIFNWQDQRVTDETARILGEDFDKEAQYRKVGWAFSGLTLPLALLCWLKVHQPKKIAQCSKVCMSTEYLFYRLTGQWGIGPSAGSPFHLLDQVNGGYIRENLALIGITEEQLPPPGKTGDLLGAVTEEGAALSGLPVGTPIYLGTFDHPSAACGAGILKEGQMLLSCGTSWVCFFPAKERNSIIDAHIIADPFLSEWGGCWAGIASVSSISARIETYIRRYIADQGNIFDVFTQEAAKSRPGAGGLAVDLLSDAPIEGWPKHHIARAIMEGTVRLLGEKIDYLKTFGIEAQEAVMVGGPSESPLWAEVIGQMLGIRVYRGPGSYAGAIGAAMMAGISAGLYEDLHSAAEALKGE